MSMIPSGLYKISNIIDNKIYYGSSINLKRRLKDHKCLLNINKHPNRHLQQSYNKYGKNSFIFEIILYCSKEDCLFYEQKFLDKYWDNSINCYNIAKDDVAPMTNIKVSLTSRINRSIRQLGSKRSEETRKKMSEAQKGNKNHQFGKSPSEETRKKMSEAHKNVIFSIETRKKMSQSQKLRYLNENKVK